MLASSKPNRVILYGIIISLAVNILINLISSEIAENPIKTFLGPTYYITVNLLVLSFLVWIAYKFDTLSNGKVNIIELIDGLKRRYKMRLAKKMDNDLKFEIQLDLIYTKVGTSQAFIEEFFIKDYQEKSANGFNNLFDIYLSSLRRLLIIGEPGAGKTVILLKFAQKLLELAEKSPDFPVPIILNLSSWRNEGQPFDIWLEQNLVYAAGHSGVSRQQAKDLTDSNQLILLLDGLDEVPEAHRDSCLQQLAAYLDEVNTRRSLGQSYPEVIICCLQEEYKMMQENAPVQATILIQVLALKSICQALEEIQRNQVRGQEADRLLKAIKDQKPVVKLLTTAFYVHLALKLAHTAKNDFAILDEPNAFLKKYITLEMAKVSNHFPLNKTYKWLRWLAIKLSQTRKGVTFELVDMQPGWLQRKWRYHLVRIFYCTFIFGLSDLIISLIAGFSSIKYASGGVALGLLIGVIATLLSKRSGENDIAPSEIRTLKKFNKRDFISGYITGLGYGFTYGTASTLIFSFVVIFVYNIGKSNSEVIFDSILSMLFQSLLENSLLYALIGGFVMGLSNGIFAIKRFAQINDPYQRFKGPLLFESIRLSLVINFITITRVSYINHWIIIGDILSTLSAILVFSSFGKHFTLRFVLWIEKEIPLRLVDFLDDIADKTGLLEKDGGQWRFRHQLIQDVLAGKEIPLLPPADESQSETINGSEHQSSIESFKYSAQTIIDNSDRKLNLFLCHSSEDKMKVLKLNNQLETGGFNPWLDKHDLIGGQEWEIEIRKQLRRSDAVLICLSKSLVNKRGIVQKEIRLALDIANEQPEGVTYIIPIKLEECYLPESLSKYHWIDLFEGDGYEKLITALNVVKMQ
jgi:hypothetical protein